jgi:hypothetical protein
MNAKAGAFAYTPEEILEASAESLLSKITVCGTGSLGLGPLPGPIGSVPGEDALRLTI